jgi:hypothetical protein
MLCRLLLGIWRFTGIISVWGRNYIGVRGDWIQGRALSHICSAVCKILLIMSLTGILYRLSEWQA